MHKHSSAPDLVLYLSLGEEGLIHDPLVYPSSDGEGHVTGRMLSDLVHLMFIKGSTACKLRKAVCGQSPVTFTTL